MRSTVLIVDDSATFREYIRSGLESAGYRVVTAESGEQGLFVAQSAQIDAFIVDNVLPGIDGASVVRRLRQQVRHRRTPSLLLTASDDPAQELNALEAGADAFVRKDESIEVLLARLSGVLRSVGAPAASPPGRDTPRAPAILFVDAGGTPAEQAAAAFSQEGMTVHICHAAELPAAEFDCIVANVAGVEEGKALLREIRARQSNRPARLILIGRADHRSELLEAISLGADDYLPCAAGDAVVTARIRAQLRRKLLEDENEQTRENQLHHEMELESERRVAAARTILAEELRVARDLAEQKAHEAEDLLAQSEAVFRSITEGLVIADLKGRLVQSNDAAIRIFGASGREALEHLLNPAAALCEIRTPAGKFVPGEEWPLALAMGGESVSNAELIVSLYQTGHTFTGSFNAVPVSNREGRQILAAVTVRDITAQKRSEDMLRRTEQLAVTGRLAASIAHEINNPLSAVMNLLFLLQKPVQADPTAAEYLATAQKELQRVADITRQTLAFYRESTKPVEVDMCALVREVEEIFSSRLRTASVELRVEIDCAVRPRAFAGELRQVISNLIANAIDASPTGGLIRMRIRAATNRGISGVRITVADHGTGIPRSFYGEIFRPFASMKGSRGTGLGLWVTHSIVARHDGRIRFHSVTRGPHCGTSFSVFIPLAPTIKNDRPDTISNLFRDLGNELLARRVAHDS